MVTNLGLKITFKKCEALLCFGKEEEREGALVNELVISVSDAKGGASTLRLNKDEAFNLARKVLVGAIELKQTEAAPVTSPIVAASKARLLDDEIGNIIGKYLDIL